MRGLSALLSFSVFVLIAYRLLNSLRREFFGNTIAVIKDHLKITCTLPPGRLLKLSRKTIWGVVYLQSNWFFLTL